MKSFVTSSSTTPQISLNLDLSPNFKKVNGWIKNTALPKTTGTGSALIITPVDVCPETDGVPVLRCCDDDDDNRLSVDLLCLYRGT